MIKLQFDNIDIMETNATCYYYFCIRLSYRMLTTFALTPFPILVNSINFHVYINHELESLRCLDPFFFVMKMHCCFVSLPLPHYHDSSNGNPHSAHTDCSVEFLIPVF